MDQTILQTKFFEIHGKACIEKEIAFERIADLENQVNALNTQIAEMGKAAADPAPDLTEIKKPTGPPLRPI